MKNAISTRIPPPPSLYINPGGVCPPGKTPLWPGKEAESLVLIDFKIVKVGIPLSVISSHNKLNFLIASTVTYIVDGIDCRVTSTVVEGTLVLASDDQVHSCHIGVIGTATEREVVGAVGKVLGILNQVIVGIQGYSGEGITDIAGVGPALGHALALYPGSRTSGYRGRCGIRATASDGDGIAGHISTSAALISFYRKGTLIHLAHS